MLYTDAEFISLADLQAVDSEIQLVATAEKMTVSNVVAQGSQEAGQKLLSRIQSAGGFYGATAELSWNHLAAVYGGSFSGNMPRVQLGQVVVTDPRGGYSSVVKLFVMYSILDLFYREVSNRMGGKADRYQSKRDSYRAALRDTYWPMLQAHGLPIVWMRMPCPAAVHENNSGTMATPAATGTGSTALAGDYDVAITWTGANYVSPLKNMNEESGPGATQTITSLTLGQFIHLDISGLNPPAQTAVNPVPVSYAGYAPVIIATGWNVYAGPRNGVLKLVNVTPIAIGTKTYNADPGLATGAVVGLGQWPMAQMPLVTTLMRA